MAARQGISITLIVVAIVLYAVRADCLDLQTAIATAIEKHPKLRAARERVSVSRAQVSQAAAPFFPQISASAGYTASESASPLGDSVMRSTTTSITANQLLYDFGRTGSVLDAARSGEESARYEEDRVLQEVIMNVREAYYGMLKSIALQTVAERNLEQSQAHYAQAEAFYRAGSRPRFDVTRTEVEVNNARLTLINTTNGVRLSRIRLSNAMGVQFGDEVDIEDIPLSIISPPSLVEAQRIALEVRPEMRRARAEISVAESRLRAEQALYLPNITAGGTYSWSDGSSAMGPYRVELDSSWNAAVTLNVYLFQGGLTRGRVAEAKANLFAAEAQLEMTAQSVLLEVNQASAEIDNASARLTVTESSLRTATENLGIAQGRYEAGVGPYIEVTDARLAELNAQVDHVQARYDYDLAVAHLEKAVGKGIDGAVPQLKKDNPER